MKKENSKVERPSWDEYFTEIARLVATRSNCESRKVGAVITVDNQIVSTGYKVQLVSLSAFSVMHSSVLYISQPWTSVVFTHG